MMKIKIGIAVIALLIINRSYSQIDTTQVPFVAYWSAGDQYNFKVTKVKQQWKEGSLAKNDSTQYLVKFEVIDSLSNAYRIRWSYKNDLANTYNIPPELIKRFSKYELTEAIYTTTETGAFTEIENWKEVSEIMNGLFSDIVEVLGKDAAMKGELKKAMEPLGAVYSSKQGIEQLVFKELQYFHFPFGMAFSTSQPIEYEEQLPNMAGGDPIKGDARLFVEEADFEQQRCVLVQQMKLNPDDTHAAIMKFFKKMGLNDKDMKEAMKNAQMNITDNNRFEYYYHRECLSK